MTAVAVDSNILYALFDRTDGIYIRAAPFLRTSAHRWTTNLPVLSEVVHMLRYSSEAQVAFLNWSSRALLIDDATSTDLPRIAEIMTKYADLPADFADAALLALCERERITRIATIDSDFDVYRLANRRRLENVFDRPR